MLKTGDEVIVRGDLREYDENGDRIRYYMSDKSFCTGVNAFMERYAGMAAHIASEPLGSSRWYSVDIDGGKWVWTDEMFEPSVEIDTANWDLYGITKEVFGVEV